MTGDQKKSNDRSEHMFHFVCSLDSIDEKSFFQIGGKATNLVKLQKAGFPVPPAYCVPVNVHAYYVERGMLPDGLVSEIVKIKERLGGKVIIRSSATCEDAAELTMAGVFRSDYVYLDEDISDSIEGIFKQSRSEEVARYMALHGKSIESVHMALVIQELIEPEVAGVIYTGVNNGGLLIEYSDGLGARLVDGEIRGSAMLTDSAGEIHESVGFSLRPMASEAVHQIVEYSWAIERIFQGIPQDIEFAYRNGILYILQARPLTTDLGRVELTETVEDCLAATKHELQALVKEEKQALGTKTAIFSDANYSEILPHPTEMDIGLHMYVWGGSDGIPGAKQIGHREMGYLIGDEAIGIIRYIGGKTYASTGRYAANYHIGFPERREEYFSTLVTEYLSAIEADTNKGAYPQMGLFLQDPTFADLELRYGAKAKEYYHIYQTFAAEMRHFAGKFISQFYATEFPQMENFVHMMQEIDLSRMKQEELLGHGIEILEHIRKISYVNFVKAARLGFYFSQRLRDLLKEKLALNDDETNALYARLNQGLEGSAITEANLAIADAVSEADAILVAKALVGHFSTGEMLEIRHLTLRDDPEKLAAYVKGIRQAGNYRQKFEKQKALRQETQQTRFLGLSENDRNELEQVVNASQTYMALRETTKYLIAKENLLFRDTLERLSIILGLEVGDIYFVYPRELHQLVAHPQSMAHLIRSRQRSFKNYAALDLPHVIREADIDNLHLSQANAENFTEATGKFLSEGAPLEGVIVNLDEYAALEEASKVFSEYREKAIPVILVATQMNLSHDPLIAQAAGLIIENAGIVAHGAQRARELGKGAIAGISSKQLTTGTKVFFDPMQKLIRKIF